jgi:phosphoribosyl 1,2-cyclic phosphodiesterase
MKFIQYYSSSEGNLYIVEAVNGERLMIECGVPWKKILAALRYDLSGVNCILTHEHKDHCRSVKDVIKAGIPVYGSLGTLDACGVFGERRVTAITAFEPVKIGKSFAVKPYNAVHDAIEPYYYWIREKIDNEGNGENLLFITDTNNIIQKFQAKFKIIAIECNYDIEIVKKIIEGGEINQRLRVIRLMESHMAKGNCLKYLLSKCDLGKCEEIHLLHLSGGNIDKEKTRAEFEKELMVSVKII